MCQAKRVAQLVDRHRVEVNSIREVGGVLLPVFIFVEMDVSSVGLQLVWVESVRQDIPRTIERVAASFDRLIV